MVEHGVDRNAPVDWAAMAEDYGRYRTAWPALFYAWLEEAGLALCGERILDLGSGPAPIGRELRARGAEVVACDPSSALLQDARAAGVPVVCAPAERLPLRTGAFDAVVAGSCFAWMDGPRALAEVRRVLRPRGLCALAHLVWLPRPGTVGAVTADLVRAASPGWDQRGRSALYPEWLLALEAAGFRALQTRSVDLDLPWSREAWRGRTRASVPVAGRLPPERVHRLDDELDRELRARFGDGTLLVPHRLFVATGRTPG